jgi:LPXTG-motif cell wall-anchored protein
VVVFATNTFMPSATKAATQQAAAAADGIGGDLNSRTQTVAALLTQAAGGTTNTTPGAGASAGGLTPTTLPTTGFVEEVGLPGMLGLSILLVAVIFFVRRMRLSGGQS